MTAPETTKTEGVTLTSNAAAKVKTLMENEDAEMVLRLGVKRAGCSGYAYDMFFDSVIDPTDIVNETDGVRVAVDADLTFGHGLEQRALRARRGAIDLVGQYYIGKHRPGPELEPFFVPAPDRNAENIGRQQITGELNALPVAANDLGHGLRQCGFADTGQVFDQKMTAGE